MYNKIKIDNLITEVKKYDGINDKEGLKRLIVDKFSLITDRSVYYCNDFAIRFSQSSRESFSNTVLSLSNLMKYDDRPFILCLVLPLYNRLFLINTTFLSKISHSSLQLRVDNIRGSFNGSDILRNIGNISNEPSNFEELFHLHKGLSIDDNIQRLVETTNDIVGRDLRFKRTPILDDIILDAPLRSASFISSNDFLLLSNDLETRVKSVKNEIIIASLIDNVNVRGRVIEYLITMGESDTLREELIQSLRNNCPLPKIKTDDDLGDYNYEFFDYNTKTDIKTKIIFLNSAPKAYNIDKLLSFLSTQKSVYMVYFIGINENLEISTHLCSIFDSTLMKSTVVQFHWAGRTSRGVTQFSGSRVNYIIENKLNDINIEEAKKWLLELLEK